MSCPVVYVLHFYLKHIVMAMPTVASSSPGALGLPTHRPPAQGLFSPVRNSSPWLLCPTLFESSNIAILSVAPRIARTFDQFFCPKMPRLEGSLVLCSAQLAPKLPLKYAGNTCLGTPDGALLVEHVFDPFQNGSFWNQKWVNWFVRKGLCLSLHLHSIVYGVFYFDGNVGWTKMLFAVYM